MLPRHLASNKVQKGAAPAAEARRLGQQVSWAAELSLDAICSYTRIAKGPLPLVLAPGPAGADIFQLEQGVDLEPRSTALLVASAQEVGCRGDIVVARPYDPVAQPQRNPPSSTQGTTGCTQGLTCMAL